MRRLQQVEGAEEPRTELMIESLPCNEAGLKTPDFSDRVLHPTK